LQWTLVGVDVDVDGGAVRSRKRAPQLPASRLPFSESGETGSRNWMLATGMIISVGPCSSFPRLIRTLAA